MAKRSGAATNGPKATSTSSITPPPYATLLLDCTLELIHSSGQELQCPWKASTNDFESSFYSPQLVNNVQVSTIIKDGLYCQIHDQIRIEVLQLRHGDDIVLKALLEQKPQFANLLQRPMAIRKKSAPNASKELPN